MMTREKLIHHYESLKEKHDELDKEIQVLYEHHTDDMKVEALKKKKLKIKDDMEQTLQKMKKFD